MTTPTLPRHLYRPLRRIWPLLLGAALFGAAGGNRSLAQDAALPPVAFNRDIRPLLSDHCFTCHGPDSGTRKAGLRLDVKEGALRKLRSGSRAVVPGRPDESSLVARVESTDDAERMPPPGSPRQLTAGQKDLLRRWVAGGAPWAEHWAFVAPKRPPLPAVRLSEWPRNGIDYFILSRLEREGLRPSPVADRARLIRRVTLDLTGLPPTPAEVEAFLNDPDPAAYEKVVDRLLASPHCAERLALNWLDVARYADTHGYNMDPGRRMMAWRDWVIDAFRRNLPFDRFTVEQLAGDLLPGATDEQRLATGFNRNHMINMEGGAIEEEFRVAYVADRVNTTGTVWLGLTVGCAQCHDHKYDPVSQKEYYQLFSFFQNVPERGVDGGKGNAPPLLQLPSTPEQLSRVERLRARLAGLRERIRHEEEVYRCLSAAARHIAPDDADWTPADPVAAEARSGARAVWLADGSLLVAGADPGRDVYQVTVRSPVSRPTALRVEVLPVNVPHGPRTLAVLFGPVVFLLVLPLAGRWIRSGRKNLTPPSPKRGWILLWATLPCLLVYACLLPALWDSLCKDLWILDKLCRLSDREPGDGEVVQINSVGVDSANPDSEDEPLYVRTNEGTEPGKEAEAPTDDGVARFQVSRHYAPEAPAPLKVMLEVRRARAGRRLRRFRFWVSGDENLIRPFVSHLKIKVNVTERNLNWALLKDTCMVMEEMARPRDAHVLIRGDYNRPGEKVEAGVPAALPPLPGDAPRNRLGMARWLTDPAHPLTARVTVNRYWQMLFGTGLVKTPGDFGAQGEPPSHPELLDWLAVEFASPSAAPGRGAAQGWDVKALLRLIVTSATYRQATAVTPGLLARDPDNRLLGRAPRVRLQAEFVRDLALAVSGLLNREVGGESVFPYQPAGLWEELSKRGDSESWTAQKYVQSRGKDLYRRSVYTFWKRSSPPPNLVAFDAPSREVCCPKRAQSNTPLQALVLLNDPTFVEAARKLAERLTAGAGSPRERIALGFRLCTSRPPRADEAEILERIYREQLAAYRRDGPAALRLLAVGESPSAGHVAPDELAAWTVVAGMLLNLDETITKG
jgi:hypothetical protein